MADDYLFVISPTTDEDKLQKQRDYYESLPYDQRALSNDACIAKYGKTNDEMFRRLFKLIYDNDEYEARYDDLEESALLEAFMPSTDYTDINDYKKKMEIYNAVIQTGLVLIPMYSNKYGMIYTLEDLNGYLNTYNSLSSVMRNQCNAESLRIYGYDILNMYEMNKVKIQNGDLEEPEEFTKSEIESYRDSVRESTDPIDYLLKQIDLIHVRENGTILESAISDSLLHEERKTYTLSSNIPPIIPYFTPEEIIESGGEYSDFIEEYSLSCPSGLYGFDYSSIFEEVKNLYREYSNTKDKVLENKIISLGWNPSVEPNDKSLNIAHIRLENYIKTKYDFELIDVSKMSVYEADIVKFENNDLVPVFIVLSYTNTKMGRIIKTVKGGNYTHASIAFESDLRHMYSFNFFGTEKFGGGISYEDVNSYVKVYKDSSIRVMALFVTRQQKAKMIAKLEYYIGNADKTRYDVRNLIRIVFNRAAGDAYNLKMVCSQFVDAILRSVNIDLTGKSTNLVAPSDFEKVKDNKVYIIYEGLVREYNPHKTDIMVKALSLDRSHAYRILSVAEASRLLLSNRDPLLYKLISINNENANQYLQEIQNLLTAESVLVESKKLPFRFNRRGDMEINFPTRIEDEYQKSHKLLIEYEKAENIDGMKEELARLWYLNNIAENRLSSINKSMGRDKVTKTRARILNDFKKYIKIVMSKDKGFKFTEYFNNSPYYDDSMVIDANTLKYSGKIIKDLILL